MKKWQITLLELFGVALGAAVFAALLESHPVRTQSAASRHEQFGPCGVELKVESHVGDLSDSAEPYETPRFKRVVYPYENFGIGSLVEGSRYADYKGVFSNQWDMLVLEIVRRDNCFGKK